VTNASVARVTFMSGGESRVATGVAVLDHLLEELARTGGFELRLEIAPDEPEAEVGKAGAALGEALAPLLAADEASGRGFGLVPAEPMTTRSNRFFCMSESREYAVIAHIASFTARKVPAGSTPRKQGKVIETMICWRDTPEYYSIAERDYEHLVGATSTERDARKSGIKKIRAFDYFTEITGRRGPGPKIVESPNFVVEVYNTDGEQFAFHRALRSEEFGLQFRGTATNMSEFDGALPMAPGDLALVPLGIAHSVITGKEFLRVVMYSRIPWDVKIDATKHAFKSSFDVRTKVIESAGWWASAAE